MAYDTRSQPRRDSNDSAYHEPSTMRMPYKGDQNSFQATVPGGGGAKSYVPPSVQDDEYREDRRPSRMPSPPASEASNPPSTEQPTGIANVSPELIAHLTERITKEVLEKVKNVATIDATTVESSKVEPTRTSDSTTEQSKAEPIARTISPEKSSSTPSPPPSAQRVYTPPSPNTGSRRATINGDSPPLSPSSPTKDKLGVRFTNPRGPADKDGTRRPAYRSFSNAELSAVDQKWGRLFDIDRKPTARLGQFLRGLANHIIEEFEPKNSIVVTPLKMAAYYTQHSLDDEVFPLASIFKSQSHEHLSELYQDLACQHHLVQEENYRAPFIPGLTPVGFAHWMTKWIIAYPDQEASRLEKVVISMPIDADGPPVDGKPERLPKQISRYLLPSKEDPEIRKEVNEAITDFLEELGMSKKRPASLGMPPLSRQTSATQPPPKIRPIDIPPPKNSSRPIERERAPYSGAPSDAGSIDDTLPIERERQPYSAHPGDGRYTETLSIPHTSGRERANSASRITRGPDLDSLQKHYRTQSSASSNPYIPAPRRGGTRRPGSPPLQKFSQSNPLNIDTGGGYPSENFSSPPKHSQSFTPTSYTPSSKFAPGLPLDPRERERDRDRDRDRERGWDPDRDRGERRGESRRRDRDSRRSMLEEPSSRRSTLEETSRMPPEVSTPRDADRRERPYDDRERDKSYEPRSAEPRMNNRGPILHQEFRPDAGSAMPDPEEYYTSRPRSEYEVGKTKYYPRN